MESPAVELAMRDVAEAEVRPRFRALAEADVDEKSGPGDLVTVADVASEKALTSRLEQIESIPVVGEEASEADPALPELLATVARAWVVDPIDGTWNFVHGKVEYAVMVALVEGGDCHSGWILHPETGELVSATRGDGATIASADGTRTQVTIASAPPRPLNELRGMAVLRFAPPEMEEGLVGLQEDLATIAPPRMCAGWDYWDLVQGDVDFLLYFRAKPWDHAPGVAIARECGFVARHLDGADYRPGEPGRPFLVARESEWEALAERVITRAGRTP